MIYNHYLNESNNIDEMKGHPSRKVGFKIKKSLRGGCVGRKYFRSLHRCWAWVPGSSHKSCHHCHYY